MTVKCPRCGEGWNPATEALAESTPNPTHIIADAVAQLEAAAPSAVAAHVMSKLTDAGYSIMPSGDVELLENIRWTVNGSTPMDLNDEFADGFNAAMRNIHRILHPAAAAEGEKP
ncbi:hypothetical protein NY08_520 [Rhodococcus sp. B7740]|nr:hypothetical protein NY08_520 [Rhodococcus sp. B7740]